MTTRAFSFHINILPSQSYNRLGLVNIMDNCSQFTTGWVPSTLPVDCVKALKGKPITNNTAT